MYSNAIAKLESQLSKGLITRKEFAAELLSLATNVAKEYSESFTFTTVVNGAMETHCVDESLDTIESLLKCHQCSDMDCCEPGPECANGCASDLFIQDLKATGKAVMVRHEKAWDGGTDHIVTTAYKN